MKQRMYIAGPISGMPGNNRPAFEQAKKFIADAGFEPVSPLDLQAETDPEKTYVEYIKQGLDLLHTCFAALFISGWEQSYGARIERLFCEREGKAIYEIRNGQMAFADGMCGELPISIGRPEQLAMQDLTGREREVIESALYAYLGIKTDKGDSEPELDVLLRLTKLFQNRQDR